ncbi:hypothetical protein [Micromonospora sp. CPCC 206061]|uniref:hypothetical protein n=1 Tax=Micromonospora sp. CPCC 206061 TaxID=3122410 RepID=UPI002FF23BD0
MRRLNTIRVRHPQVPHPGDVVAYARDDPPFHPRESYHPNVIGAVAYRDVVEQSLVDVGYP